MMSELGELKVLLSESGLSKRELLCELIDALTNDKARCGQCDQGCINCEARCNSGPTAK